MDTVKKDSAEHGRVGLLHLPWNFLLLCYRTKILKVEIAVVLYLLANSFSLPLCEQYYYHSFGSDILRNTSFAFPNGTFCVSSELINNNTGSNDSYKQAESESNHLVTYVQFASTTTSVLATVLVLGPLTNRYGRKLGIIVPVIGTTLQNVIAVLIVYFNLQPYYFILSSFVGGASGSFTCLLASSCSYVADISSPRWRSLRIGFIEAGLAFGGSAGTLFGGYWLRKINCNFLPPLWFFVGCNVLILVYTLFLIPESLNRSEREKLLSNNPKGIKSYVQGFKFYFGGLSWKSTWKLYVATLTLDLELINVYGAILIDVYFLKALPFDFNPLQIGIYQGVRSGAAGLANVVFVGVLVALKVGDSCIMLIAILFHCVCNVLLGFSNQPWQLFTLAAVRGVEGTVWAGARGLMSKLVRPEQQGSLFAIITSTESVSCLLASAIWPVIFPLTLQYNMRSGMTYVFMAALGSLLLPPLISLLFLKKDDVPVNVNRSIQEDTEDKGEDDVSKSQREYTPLLSSVSKSLISQRDYTPLLSSGKAHLYA